MFCDSELIQPNMRQCIFLKEPLEGFFCFSYNISYIMILKKKKKSWLSGVYMLKKTPCLFTPLLMLQKSQCTTGQGEGSHNKNAESVWLGWLDKIFHNCSLAPALAIGQREAETVTYIKPFFLLHSRKAGLTKLPSFVLPPGHLVLEPLMDQNCITFPYCFFSPSILLTSIVFYRNEVHNWQHFLNFKP